MTNNFPMVRDVPFMGVSWVVDQSMKFGYYNGSPDWCNLGQGQTEVGEIEDAPKRIEHIDFLTADHGYGPAGGILEARQAVAELYNELYRKGMKSKYTADNVSIASGGRLALTRLFSILSDGTRILYKNPDYTAYEDYLYYQRLHTIPICEYTKAEEGFSIPSQRLNEIAIREGINAFIFSNPCNPTGVFVQGEELADYADIARRHNILLGIDEFYLQYVYNEFGGPCKSVCSAATFVENVDKDPVIIIDGLTKNNRYPGWRISWTLGPTHCIDMINRAASALDGGASMLSQRAMLKAIERSVFEKETAAIRKCFDKKRKIMLEKLHELEIYPVKPPLSTFYIWANIEKLPAPINDGDTFLYACLKEKVMVIPGRFFDIRPYRDRIKPEPLRHWVRFSYGPCYETIREGMERIARVVHSYK